MTYCQVSCAETPVNQVRYLRCIDLVTFSAGPKSSFPQLRTMSPSSWQHWLPKAYSRVSLWALPSALGSCFTPGYALSQVPLTSSTWACTKTQSSRFDLSQLWKATPAPELLVGLAEAFVAASSQLDFSSYAVLLPSLPSRACCWEDPRWPSCRQISTSRSVSQGTSTKTGGSDLSPAGVLHSSGTCVP